MRKWRGDRRRSTPQQDASAEQEPVSSGGVDSEESPQPPDEMGLAQETQPEASAGGTSPGGQQKKGAQRGRGRRRKKRPETGSAPRARAQQPIIPAYTDTEGPRAPLPVAVSPGAPTGEAAELDVEPAPRPVPAPPVAAAVKRAPKGAVVLSVGLPGSGKTTWFKRKGVTPLSSDLLRTLLFDDPTQQAHQDLVFSSLRYLLRARLMARMPMNYVDATNLSPKERRHWIRMAREFGYEVHAVFFEVPLQTCLERNRKRQRVVPEEVMQRMSAKLRPPTFEEGFSKIIVVRVKHRPAEEATAEQAAPEPPEPSAEEAGAEEPGSLPEDSGEPDIE